MERVALRELIAWKDSPYRKPLLVTGARQVGKTWLLRDFVSCHYDNVAYINFEEVPEYKEIFKPNKEIKRIIPCLSMALGQDILPGKTLLVLDEIQECPEALIALKYFCENAPEYHVVAATSLLGCTS